MLLRTYQYLIWYCYICIYVYLVSVDWNLILFLTPITRNAIAWPIFDLWPLNKQVESQWNLCENTILYYLGRSKNIICIAYINKKITSINIIIVTMVVLQSAAHERNNYKLCKLCKLNINTNHWSCVWCTIFF